MNRQDQYKRKFEFILDKIMNLPKNPAKNEFYTDALFYRLQISIDATMDVIAMLCKDLGISVKDDYKNIDELEILNLFEMKTLEDLRRWNGLRNGLRNVLVHKYNKIENEIIFKNKAQVIKSLKEFVKKAEEIIDDRIFKSKKD